MTAGVAGSKLLTREALDRASNMGEQLRQRMRQTFESYPDSYGHATGFGSVVGYGFTGPHADLIRESFFYYMAKKRIYTGIRGFMALNILHEESHIDRVSQAVESFCEELYG